MSGLTRQPRDETCAERKSQRGLWLGVNAFAAYDLDRPIAFDHLICDGINANGGYVLASRESMDFAESDLLGLIRPGGLAFRSCDPHICFHPDQPSRLVGMRGDFQRKGSACSNLSSIVQEQPSTASWSRLRPAPRKAVNFKNWNDASLRWRITSRSSPTITRVPCTFRP